MSMTHIRCFVLLTVALAACQRQSPQESTSVAPPSGAADTAAIEASPESETPALGTHPGESNTNFPRDTTLVDARVVDVNLSNRGDTVENTIGMPIAIFAPTDTVYAEIRTTGTAGNYTLYAKWLAPDGTALSDYGVEINEAGPKRTVISLSKPDGWSRGVTSIELAINGKTARTVNFDVQ